VLDTKLLLVKGVGSEALLSVMWLMLFAGKMLLVLIVINDRDSPKLEREADVMGAKAMRG
jgi:hypothetical protein